MTTEAQTQVNPWETGTGMADDFDGVMTECFFGVDERYNADAVLFCSTLVDKDGEPITTIKYSVGDGWVTNQDGSEISHPVKQQINNSSRYGFFIDRLVKPKAEKAPKSDRLVSPAGKGNGLELGSLLVPRGNPFQAKTFEGLTFHWNLHKGWTMGKDEKGETQWKDVLYPTQFLGQKGGAGVATTAKVKPAEAVASAPAVATATSNGELPIPLRKKLTLLALEAGDIKTFIQKASRDREVLALPDEVMGHVLDTSAEGFYAQANA